MKRLILIVIIAFFIMLFSLPKSSFAIEDPLSLPNNKMGVHILFTSEIESAAELINKNGGDWGYVTIPIQSGDRDMEKWQKFMDDAKRLHIIPLIRLATEGDYFDTKVWRKPTKEDVLDFANFLNSLVWPVKNRYIIVFNEVNRSDEWEGNLNPKEYAEILSYSAKIFKSLNPDFFIISSGMDNAAPNISGKYMNEYDYMTAMHNAVPGIFGQIDGLGSHAYPNPGFRQVPHLLTSQSIYSFNFEKDLAFKLCGKKLPVFITETGWSKEAVPESQIASYFKYAFEHVWSDKSVVAVTSFLLQGGQGPFSQFSLLNADGIKNKIFLVLEEISKTKGAPTINSADTDSSPSQFNKLPVKAFPKRNQYNEIPLQKAEVISGFLKWLLRLSA